MTSRLFNEVIRAKLDRCLQTLHEKGRLYAQEEDRLNQFRRLGSLLGLHPALVGITLMSKHFAALRDIVDKPQIRIQDVEELTQDLINYTLLVYCILIEQLEGRSQNG